jgi:hypothetical protein
MKIILVGISLAMFVSVAQSNDATFECRGIPGLPDDWSRLYPSDVEHSVFRIEYRSPNERMKLTLRGQQLTRQEGAPEKGTKGNGEFQREFPGVLIVKDFEGKIWSFTSSEFPDGSVLYMYDANRNVLTRTFVTYTYPRGKDPKFEPDTGKQEIIISIYRCSVSMP